MKLAIVIPAHNESKVIEAVLKSLPRKLSGIDEIVSVVVDDGSSDNTHVIASKHCDYAIKHIINLGVGAATTTGIEAAKKIHADMIVTIDADGQHHPKDILKIIQPILDEKADVVIGTRMSDSREMPTLKIFGNWLMNVLTLLVFQKWSTDTQSGMKALNKRAIRKIVLHSQGYEFCSELIGEIKRNNLKMAEVPIQTIYTDHSKKNGQHWLNGINILTKSISIKLFGGK